MFSQSDKFAAQARNDARFTAATQPRNANVNVGPRPINVLTDKMLKVLDVDFGGSEYEMFDFACKYTAMSISQRANARWGQYGMQWCNKNADAYVGSQNKTKFWQSVANRLEAQYINNATDIANVA